MASIRHREQADGKVRITVRYRVHGRAVEESCRTETAAKALKRKIEAGELAGTTLDPRGGDMLFDDYARHWLQTRLVRGKPLTPMTRKGYDGLLKRHISPAFGRARLRRISAEQVRAWYAKTTQKAGSDAAAKSYRLLRAIFATAVLDDRVARSPARIRGAGIERARERPMLPTATVLDLADAIAPRLKAAVLLAGTAGLRTGELIGLQRADIDQVHSTVRIQRQIHEVSKAQNGSTRVTTSPKSDAGRRTVVLPKVVMDAVADHLARFTAPDPEAPVFASKRGGQPLSRHDLSTEWRAALAKVPEAPAGLHVHDLRHHSATVMARQPGVTLAELMKRIGHSSPQAALRYQHSTAERDQAAAAWLDEQIAATERPTRASVTQLEERATP